MNKVLEAIDEMRAGNSSYVTNAFFSYGELENLFETEQVYTREGLIAFTKKTEHCDYLYWFAADCTRLNGLCELLDTKKTPPIITEILGDESFCEKLCPQLTGFLEHNRLTRMLYKASGEYEKAAGLPSVAPAKPTDVDGVSELLFETFDVLTSHLPGKDELLDMIAKEEIFTVEGDPKKGIAIFNKLSPRMWYLFQIAVGSNYRRRGYANALLSEKLSTLRKNDKLTLWSEDNNPNVREMYKALGFELTDMHTIIYKGV